jgi:hypothetical protein
MFVQRFGGQAIMALKKKKARKRVKTILTITIPIYVIALAFCILGVYLMNNERIYSSVSIDGVDVSRLTREAAIKALDVEAYDARGKNAEVMITFPDYSELRVTGEDVRFAHDARDLIDEAFSRGRGQGFVMDTVSFLQRTFGQYVLNDAGESYEVSYGLGAGQVRASEYAVFELAFDGLFDSLSEGRAVEISYVLPESDANVPELVAIRESIFATPVSARIDFETMEVTESALGADIDIADAIALLAEAMSGEAVAIYIEYVYPDVTREYLESLLFRDLIGECVTHIDGTAHRLNNIVLASAAINGMILEPQEEFSFNQVVGRRTAERGYMPGPAFIGGRIVQALGGGICQVSSTIYSAIMDTDILVTERYAHSMRVAYLPRGRDATVSWGSLDFRFVNNTGFPLRIEVEVDGRNLTARVFGTLYEYSDA